MNSANDIDKFKKMVTQIKSLIAEFSVLSKKNPNDAVNKFKITLINPILRAANHFVKDAKYKPFQDFDLFKEEELPTNSDVLVILSQYNTCLAQYFKDNRRSCRGDYYWVVRGRPSSIIAPRSYDFI